MCGIAGIIKFDHPEATPAPWHRGDSSSLTKMSNAIAHRGPDGEGRWTDPRPTKTIALLHRRLAIIDLACGHQPMANEDASVHVVFNGEIYNHADLRAELSAAGHTFVSHHSDTEVLLHGWEQWGTDLPAKLRGMFAFALWDTRPDQNGRPRDTLFLARDRMGQKPLFYATLEDGLVFASTIPAILTWPEVPRRVPKEQIALYLQLGYIPPPQTIWRDISQLAPAHWLRLRGELLDGGPYWSPTPTSPQIKNQKSKIKNPQNSLRDTLSQSVHSQLVADVPIACFLSGGIDSSIIASLMQSHVRAAGGDPIHTVSVGFAESAFDETPFAAAVAQKIGSHHTRLQVNANQNILPTLQHLMRTSLGQPFADASLLPTYHLSKAVRDIAPVALSGDGADELFAGYDRYRAMRLLSRWRYLARLLPAAIPLTSRRQERLRRLTAAARAPSLPERYTRLTELFPHPLVEELMAEPADDWLPDEVEYPLPPYLSPLRYAMRRDQLEYLPGDVLWKVDSASMAHALEVRSPFLDHSLIDLANALSDDQLLAHNQGKAILRSTFASDLPDLVRTRSKKGFALPIADWLRADLGNTWSEIVLAQTSFTRQHLHAPTAERLMREHQSGARDHGLRLFSLLMLELWAKQFEPAVE